MLHYLVEQFGNWILDTSQGSPQLNLWHVGILFGIGIVGVIVFETVKYFLEERYRKAYEKEEMMQKLKRKEAIESWHKYREANGL